jgi:hypothetical protein
MGPDWHEAIVDVNIDIIEKSHEVFGGFVEDQLHKWFMS